ncbi:ABC transporter ATP-binding protein/permease [Pectobacterium polaris]|uniref:ABC transporter ATP-binding protein/permease n=1 Tax=Pectobacterium polaris TaxID=2042057 RepID=UPI002B24A82E|nr:ATP-binding cassette domain-containing protein [Pectobacterium polaris]
MTVMLSELLNDPRKYRIDRVFFRRVYQLGLPYWVRPGAWKSWLAAALLLGLIALFSLSGAYLSSLTADVTNALVDKNQALYWSLFLWFTLFGVLRFGATLAQQFVDSLLNQHWWQWLTTHLMDDYLSKRTYYEILMDEKIDNPDQRIQNEVEPFCRTLSMLPRRLLGTTLDIGVQAGILMSISTTMFVSVIVYAALQTVLMYFLYKPTIKQNFDITVSEADLRYGLTHVRTNAENIAFYQGESVEKRHIMARMGNVVVKQMRSIIYGIYIQIVNTGTGLIWTVMPLVILVPAYFSGEINYGTIGQATMSASLLLSSLSLITNFIPQLSQAVPGVIRLAEIREKFVELEQGRQEGDASRLTLTDSPTIRLKNVNLQTPGGEQALVHGLNIELSRHARLVVVGRTGVGKSSLLRAMAGLWNRGEGEIALPQGERDCLFLPQRPYTFLGDLRSQLCYPLTEPPVSDEALATLLQQVVLGDLLQKHGNLDTVKDWSKVLSLGEQQRISFARVMLFKPRYIFLDEATSALDNETEGKLYRLLESSGFSYISIGHRESLLRYHETALRLLEGGKWQLLPTSQIRMQAAETQL